jgi:hypothetical protein
MLTVRFAKFSTSRSTSSSLRCVSLWCTECAQGGCGTSRSPLCTSHVEEWPGGLIFSCTVLRCLAHLRGCPPLHRRSVSPTKSTINAGSSIRSLSDDAAACWPTATQASHVWQTLQRANEASLPIKTTSCQLSPGGLTPQVVVSLDKFLFGATLQNE